MNSASLFDSHPQRWKTVQAMADKVPYIKDKRVKRQQVSMMLREAIKTLKGCRNA